MLNKMPGGELTVRPLTKMNSPAAEQWSINRIFRLMWRKINPCRPKSEIILGIRYITNQKYDLSETIFLYPGIYE